MYYGGVGTMVSVGKLKKQKRKEERVVELGDKETKTWPPKQMLAFPHFSFDHFQRTIKISFLIFSFGKFGKYLRNYHYGLLIHSPMLITFFAHFSSPFSQHLSSSLFHTSTQLTSTLFSSPCAREFQSNKCVGTRKLNRTSVSFSE